MIVYHDGSLPLRWWMAGGCGGARWRRGRSRRLGFDLSRPGVGREAAGRTEQFCVRDDQPIDGVGEILLQLLRTVY